MFGFKEKIKRLENKVVLRDEMLKEKDRLLDMKNEKIRLLEHNNEVLVKKEVEMLGKIKDLENNIEFLYNNLSPQKRKLIRPDAN